MEKEKSNINFNKSGIITYTIKIDWLSGLNTGWGNGYIGVPRGHKWYGGGDYDNDDLPDVHGGWTFAQEEEINGDYYWVFGFDTCHLGDNRGKWTEAKVIEEIESKVKYFN